MGGADDVLGLGGESLVAHLGVDGDELFIQPAGEGAPILCNGVLLTTSRWLRDGDRLRVGDQQILCARSSDGYRLTVRTTPAAPPAEAPRLVPPPRASRESAAGPRIEPVAYSPPELGRGRRLRGGIPWRGLTLLALLGALAAPAWFLLTARSVALVVEPEPESMTLAGGLVRLRLGDRYLLRPGSYLLKASRPGHQELEATLQVGSAADQSFTFQLQELPGVLQVRTRPPSGGQVWVDGRPVGREPLTDLEVEKGERVVRIAAEGYLEHVEALEIEGLGRRQEHTPELTPLLAPVSVRSQPAGARIRVDGQAVGTTPATVEILAGSHRLELELDGFEIYRRAFTVQPDEPLALPLATLTPAAGELRVASAPPGATVAADGIFRGSTPLTLKLKPGEEHQIVVDRAGYQAQTHRLELAPAESRELAVELVALRGEIEVAARPAGAELYVDGEPRGDANQTLTLLAVPHELEIRLPGFLPHRQTVTPRPGFPQSVQVTLETEEELRQSEIEPVIRTGQGQELRLISGARFQMGASRREPGRRANEALRMVEIRRSFYLAIHEVTNRQFREFAPDHRSGRAGAINLETDHHPVVRVSWEDAVRYCNWLSEKDSLPPFYVQRSGRWEAAQPMTRGYRLPLEAEWARAARYPESGGGRKYPWGESLPVPSGAGNFADAAARELLRDTLPGYDDGYAATAPVDAFEPNPLGLFNLGGNVAEWVHDFYSLYAGGASEVEVDPTGPGKGEFHVIRGSSWMHSSITELRSSFRDYGADPRPDLGFRVARFLEGARR